MVIYHSEKENEEVEVKDEVQTTYNEDPIELLVEEGSVENVYNQDN